MNRELLNLLDNPDVPNWAIGDWLEERGQPVANVYVVFGYTGEYSDRTDWTVAAFLSEDAAKKLCEELNQWLMANKLHISTPRDERAELNRYYDPEWDDGPVPIKPEKDPKFTCDYTGAHYGVEEAPLRGTP